MFHNTPPDLQDQDRFFGLRPVLSKDRRSQTTSLIPAALAHSRGPVYSLGRHPKMTSARRLDYITDSNRLQPALQNLQYYNVLFGSSTRDR